MKPRRQAGGLFLCLAAGAALAAERIVPTDDPGSDCVAARIFAQRTRQNLKYDALYCAVNKQRPAYDRCLRHVSANETVTFFTDRCNAPDEGAYLSINGQTHLVRRDSRSAHPEVAYAGTYKGDGVVVRIVPKRRIERFFDGSERIGVKYAVDVFIEREGRSVKITAVYDDRP